jgi:transcriptional regulator with XRE-family HTH domain
VTDKPLSRNIARNVRALRLERGLTVDGLVARMGAQGQPVNRMSIVRLERGARRIDVDEWRALAAALNAAPDRLLADAPTCEQCSDAPPSGYACLTCGAKGGTG